MSGSRAGGTRTGEKASSFSLYLHIPYCLSKCPYCDFNSYAAKSWPEQRYADALLRELAARADHAPWHGRQIDTIFFGGGTPSLFQPATIAHLLDGIASRFALAADVEITLEANPGTVELRKLQGFRSAGVNRMSFGVQSFQPELLLRLGRGHSVEDSREALRAARRAGFERLSLDLIYAIPGQSLDACDDDLESALALDTEHLSAYSLTFEEGTPYRRDRDAGRLRPVVEELEVAMHQRVRERLARAGFQQYEISNFARPGFDCRHNQAYWTGIPYLGLGAGANSFAPGMGPTTWGRRWESLRDPYRYMEAVAEGGIAEAWFEDLTLEQAIGEYCWLGLRRREGISTASFLARFDRDLEASFTHLPSLIDDGMLERQRDQWRLTRRGELYADSVFASFFG